MPKTLSRQLAPLLAALALTACGGGGDDTPCRPDFVGPPAPEQAELPVCPAVDCTSQPGGCS